MCYCPTHLEQWVSEWYIKMGIMRPSDINVDVICEARNILYQERPIYSHYMFFENVKIIIVDKRLNKIDKRQEFFHELGHIELHSGIQTEIPKRYCSLQEHQANNFCRYALIPYHMFGFIDFYSESLIQDVSDIFQVNRNICIDRLREIKRRIEIEKLTLQKPLELNLLL